MRNIQTREGYEFWDKICAVQSYAFLLSPDGRRVVKTPDIGDWIDKHDAQVIVDHAQEDFNVMKDELTAAQSELAALREELANEKNRYARDVDSADEETSALREIIRDLKDWRECSQSLAVFASILDRAESVIPAPGPLRKALTAAEQRNSELEVLLMNTAQILRSGNGYGWETAQADLIDAALKPTESGASE